MLRYDSNTCQGSKVRIIAASSQGDSRDFLPTARTNGENPVQRGQVHKEIWVEM